MNMQSLFTLTPSFPPIPMAKQEGYSPSIHLVLARETSTQAISHTQQTENNFNQFISMDGINHSSPSPPPFPLYIPKLALTRRTLFTLLYTVVS